MVGATSTKTCTWMGCTGNHSSNLQQCEPAPKLAHVWVVPENLSVSSQFFCKILMEKVYQAENLAKTLAFCTTRNAQHQSANPTGRSDFSGKPKWYRPSQPVHQAHASSRSTVLYERQRCRRRVLITKAGKFSFSPPWDSDRVISSLEVVRYAVV